MATEDGTRPAAAAVASGGELRRWYWLKSELIALARARGVPAGGGKLELLDRLAADLDGRAATRPTRQQRPTAAPLPEPLTRETVIPAGQRASQQLRSYFEAQVGPAFRFDGAMRDFIAAAEGRTLGDAVDHWHATRGLPVGEIAPQFELNRFLRAWHAAHPDGTGEQARAAWGRHRSLPVEARGGPGVSP